MRGVLGGRGGLTYTAAELNFIPIDSIRPVQMTRNISHADARFFFLFIVVITIITVSLLFSSVQVVSRSLFHRFVRLRKTSHGHYYTRDDRLKM